MKVKGYKYNVNAILNAMAQKEMSLKDLSEETDISLSTLTNIVKRRNERIYLQTALRLAKALDLDVNDIIEV